VQLTVPFKNKKKANGSWEVEGVEKSVRGVGESEITQKRGKSD